MTDECGGPGHTHRLPRALLLTLVIICVGLVASIVLVSVQTVQTNRRLVALENFIAERGEVRDQQYKTLDQRITRKICDALDGLPAGGLLDEVRTENGCGPGIPVADLPPAALDQLRQYADGLPLTTRSDLAAPPSPYAQPAEPTQDAPATSPPAPVSPSPVATATAPSAPAPSPAPASPTVAPPLVDLGPITSPVCDALRVCF